MSSYLSNKRSGTVILRGLDIDKAEVVKDWNGIETLTFSSFG